VRRKLALAALALVTLGASMAASPAPAGAATLAKASWWYRAHTADSGSFLPPATPAIPGGAPKAPAPVPAPAPPSVPEGSALVEGATDGANAIAALSWTLAAGEMAPVLTITPGTSSNVPDGAVILACRAAVAWEKPETEPGTWEEKPLVDCGQSVQGIPSPDGSIAFGLAPLLSGTTLDVVLTPGIAQSQPTRVGSTFSLSFDTATGATLKTDVEAPVFAPSPAASSGSATSTTPTYSAPASTYTPPASSQVAQPALEPQEQAPNVPMQTALPPTVPLKDDRTAQGVGFLVLLAGLAFAGLAYVTPARAENSTIGLGRFRRPAPAIIGSGPAEPVKGGLGRFARPRTGPPPALS
jgi:hypothetical protein